MLVVFPYNSEEFRSSFIPREPASAQPGTYLETLALRTVNWGQWRLPCMRFPFHLRGIMKNIALVAVSFLCLAPPAFCGNPNAVPEPGSLILFGTVVAGVSVFSWYKAKKR